MAPNQLACAAPGSSASLALCNAIKRRQLRGYCIRHQILLPLIARRVFPRGPSGVIHSFRIIRVHAFYKPLTRPSPFRISVPFTVNHGSEQAPHLGYSWDRVQNVIQRDHHAEAIEAENATTRLSPSSDVQ